MEKKTPVFSVGFYNLENLFDSVNDAFTLDKDYTPDGKLNWDEQKYETKIRNIGRAIAAIGTHRIEEPPVFLGVAEVENDKVLEDLIASEAMQPHDYDFVHYESPDERGIDVAFLYRKAYFELIYSDTYTLMLEDEMQNRDYTRDILLVHGKLFGQKIYVLVNHWPSRNKGISYSENKRISAAQEVHQVVKDIYKEDPHPHIVIMGDFNDEPKNKSIRQHLVGNQFFNAMEDLQQKGMGSLYHRKKWYMFDQIIMTRNFLEKPPFRFIEAGVFNDYFLQEKYGKHKGAPLRTYLGKHYVGGFSDHFPVMAFFEKEH